MPSKLLFAGATTAREFTAVGTAPGRGGDTGKVLVVMLYNEDAAPRVFCGLTSEQARSFAVDLFQIAKDVEAATA